MEMLLEAGNSAPISAIIMMGKTKWFQGERTGGVGWGRKRKKIREKNGG
jgi:hypothetical protein